MNVIYYQCRESGNVYAVVAEKPGIFQLSAANLHNGPWTFLAPWTSAWDFVHQKIFRNHRAVEIDPTQFDEGLPEVPEPPEGPFPSWAENQGTGSRTPCARFPHLAKYVKSNNDPGIDVFVVLVEDRYESAFGDGKFLDFEETFVSREDADHYVKANGQDQWVSRSVRRFSIEFGGSTLIAPDFEPADFEHYKLTEVMAALEQKLARVG